MIRIKSKRHNFRRCGMAHPKEAVQYPYGRFSKAELAALQAEPMLVVEIVEEQKAPEPAPETVAEAGDTPAPPAEKPADSGKEPVKTAKKGKR